MKMFKRKRDILLLSYKNFKQLLPNYLELGCLDETFLYIRNILSFNDAWKHYAVHTILSNNTSSLIKYISEVRMKCSDFNFDLLSLELDSYVSNNYQSLITYFDPKLHEKTNFQMAIGCDVVMIASYKSILSDNYQEGMEYLNAVILGENDFPWLSDSILLAKAALANKFQVRQEEAFKQKFLANQPLLFEPPIVLSLGMLSYQEKLKTQRMAV